MKKYFLFGVVFIFLFGGCNNKEAVISEAKSETDLSCKLTSAELQLRRETVIASLKTQVLEKKELPDGYAFKFNGSDKMVDELSEFIKTERECCDFFTFNLSISGDKSEVWLELKGIAGAKSIISEEIGL